MNEPKVRTFMDRVRDAVQAFRGKPIGSITFGVDIKQCKDCEVLQERTLLKANRDKILYRCDGKACGPECPNSECDLTSNILHARNFNYFSNDGVYIEKSDDKTLDEELDE